VAIGELDIYQDYAKHPDMVLLHAGSPKGAERIAACWAEARKVTQIAFKPNWTKHAKPAPFRRNDEMLSVIPAGLIVFPETASPATSLTMQVASACRSAKLQETACEPFSSKVENMENMAKMDYMEKPTGDDSHEAVHNRRFE